MNNKVIRTGNKYYKNRECTGCHKESLVRLDSWHDKKNCNPENLITLCRSCHSKTNTNREYWLKYYSITD